MAQISFGQIAMEAISKLNGIVSPAGLKAEVSMAALAHKEAAWKKGSYAEYDQKIQTRAKGLLKKLGAVHIGKGYFDVSPIANNKLTVKVYEVRDLLQSQINIGNGNAVIVELWSAIAVFLNMVDPDGAIDPNKESDDNGSEATNE